MSTFDNSKVFEYLKDKSAQWDHIGRSFEVDGNTREGLRRNTGLTDDARLEKVIGIWFERTGSASDLTWPGFISILKDKMKFNDVARKVEGLEDTFKTMEGKFKDYLLENTKEIPDHPHKYESNSGIRHSMTLGTVDDEDVVLYFEDIRKTHSLVGSVSHTFKYTCKPGETIKAVIVHDCWDDDTGGQPDLKKGGPNVNDWEVEIEVTSQIFRGLHFRFYVYGTKQ